MLKVMKLHLGVLHSFCQVYYVAHISLVGMLSCSWKFGLGSLLKDLFTFGICHGAGHLYQTSFNLASSYNSLGFIQQSSLNGMATTLIHSIRFWTHTVYVYGITHLIQHNPRKSGGRCRSLSVIFFWASALTVGLMVYSYTFHIVSFKILWAFPVRGFGSWANDVMQASYSLSQ